MTAALLLVLLAVEGLTILRVRALLTPHVVIGMVLVPVVLLKIGSVDMAPCPLLPRGPRVPQEGTSAAPAPLARPVRGRADGGGLRYRHRVAVLPHDWPLRMVVPPQGDVHPLVRCHVAARTRAPARHGAPRSNGLLPAHQEAGARSERPAMAHGGCSSHWRNPGSRRRPEDRAMAIGRYWIARRCGTPRLERVSDTFAECWEQSLSMRSDAGPDERRALATALVLCLALLLAACSNGTPARGTAQTTTSGRPGARSSRRAGRHIDHEARHHLDHTSSEESGPAADPDAFGSAHFAGTGRRRRLDRCGPAGRRHLCRLRDLAGPFRWHPGGRDRLDGHPPSVCTPVLGLEEPRWRPVRIHRPGPTGPGGDTRRRLQRRLHDERRQGRLLHGRAAPSFPWLPGRHPSSFTPTGR